MLPEMLEMLAERTGLEPATPGVTGRYSNQLNYRSNFMARLVLAIPFEALKMTPGRRKGAKFSKESEKYTRDACLIQGSARGSIIPATSRAMSRCAAPFQWASTGDRSSGPLPCSKCL